MEKSNVCRCWASSIMTSDNGQFIIDRDEHTNNISNGISRISQQLVGESMKFYFDPKDRNYDNTVKILYSDQVIINGYFIRKQLKVLKKKFPNNYKEIISILFQGMEFKKPDGWKKFN